MMISDDVHLLGGGGFGWFVLILSLLFLLTFFLTGLDFVVRMIDK